MIILNKQIIEKPIKLICPYCSLPLSEINKNFTRPLNGFWLNDGEVISTSYKKINDKLRAIKNNFIVFLPKINLGTCKKCKEDYYIFVFSFIKIKEKLTKDFSEKLIREIDFCTNEKLPQINYSCKSSNNFNWYLSEYEFEEMPLQQHVFGVFKDLACRHKFECKCDNAINNKIGLCGESNCIWHLLPYDYAKKIISIHWQELYKLFV